MEMGNLFKQPEGKGFKFTYKPLKKCVMKREAGEETEECKKLFADMGIKEVTE